MKASESERARSQAKKLDRKRRRERDRSARLRSFEAERARHLASTPFPKMSEVLWSFAEPVLPPLESASVEEVRERLDLAVLVWNQVLLDQLDGSDTDIESLRRDLLEAGIDEDELAAVDVLRSRKLSEFGSDARFILDFRLDRAGSGFHLAVARSLLPPRLLDRAAGS
jgi:hypothetical protein